ncbi:MAG: hypothetical protein ABTQ34_05875 [Bdellovibrionales bacterium]
MPDTDDYTYVNQVLDWLKGQGWHDNVQHRLNPPQGTPIHFSRIAQLPMAGLVSLLEFCGFGPKGAATIMALIYPAFLFAGFCAAMRWLARCFVPNRWSGASAYIALFATATLFMFQPGHIDHHGLNILLITLSLGCAARMIRDPARSVWGFGAGAFLALSLTIALEVLPWLLLISGWVGLAALARGPLAARQGLAFGVALHFGSLVGLLLTRAPHALGTLDALSYSMTYVLLTGGIAFTLVVIALAWTVKFPRSVVWLIGVVVPVSFGTLFLHRFPELLVGPYGGMDPALSQIILGVINEAQPLKSSQATWLDVSRNSSGALIALVALGVFLWRDKDAQARWRWALLALILVGAMGLSIFYQKRYMAAMGMASIVPLLALLQRGWGRLSAWRVDDSRQARTKVLCELGLLLLVGPLPSVIYPAVLDGRKFNTDMLLFPAMKGSYSDRCGMHRLENVLRDPLLLGGEPKLIMNTLGDGPELLFRTQHKVLSAPYHMNVEGNIDATRFFSTPYPEEARDIAMRRGVDIVVLCRYFPEMYMRVSMAKGPAVEGNNKDFAAHFIMLLVTGKHPDWLKPVIVPGLNNFVIYKVVK